MAEGVLWGVAGGTGEVGGRGGGVEGGGEGGGFDGGGGYEWEGVD